MERLAILGASGHGKVVAEIALASGWDEVFFFDDAWPGKSFNGTWPISGSTSELLKRLDEFRGVVVGIGECSTRWRKHQELRHAGAPLVNLQHPFAWVSPSATLGAGTVVMAGAVVNADARIGEACIVNTGATVDHDCILDDAVHVCPGAHLSGQVRVGRESWIGVGAVVRQDVEIGCRVMVGAGAAVIAHAPDGVVLVGTPARPMKKPEVTQSC
jgi:sugar O-acyltransferase (sialic acid O-acetyltransferase NeuD family)